MENVGYVIPTPVVHHFLSDYVENGTFTGFPGLGIQWQRMESEALRKAYHMKQGQKGKAAAGFRHCQFRSATRPECKLVAVRLASIMCLVRLRALCHVCWGKLVSVCLLAPVCVQVC